MGRPVHKTWKRGVSVPSFVNSQFRTLVRPSGNSEVEAVVFSTLAGIHTGACANRTWHFGDPLVAVRVNLLVDKNETFATGDVNAFPRWVIPHIVRAGRSRKARDHFARLRI